MSSVDFDKRRKARRKKTYEKLTPKVNSYLIVTEGKRTEPLYFNGLKNQILSKIGGTVDVVEAPAIEICGRGMSTGKLIEITERLVQRAKTPYQHIWVVFDKDDFDDFDEAIKQGKAKGYNIAWSNQSFEYWIYLHFQYCVSALRRDVWVEMLDKIFRQQNIGDGTYKKNYENIYELLNKNGGVKKAIKHAERRMAEYDESRMKPSQYDPGTTVHNLVIELNKYLSES